MINYAFPESQDMKRAGKVRGIFWLDVFDGERRPSHARDLLAQCITPTLREAAIPSEGFIGSAYYICLYIQRITMFYIFNVLRWFYFHGLMYNEILALITSRIGSIY